MSWWNHFGYPVFTAITVQVSESIPTKTYWYEKINQTNSLIVAHIGFPEQQNPACWIDENIDETYFCGQKWPNHATLRESGYEFYLSSTYLHSGDVKNQVFSPLSCMLSRLFPQNCRLEKLYFALRDVICIARGDSMIVGRSVPASYIREQRQSIAAKWFLQLPPEYTLTATDRKIRLIKISTVKYVFLILWW